MTGPGAAPPAIERVDSFFSANDAHFRSWLSELTAAPSVAPDEEPAQRVVERLATAAGLETTWLTTTSALLEDTRFIPTGHTFDARPNVVVTAPGTDAPAIVLNAHIDVVEDGVGWTRDPRGAWEGERFFGRGACDTEASTTAALMAMACITELELRAAPLVLHSVVDEEPGGNGTLAVVRQLQQGSPPQLAVIMEPSGLDVLLGHRGMLWYRIVCAGRQGHGSTGEGVNAILDAAAVVASIDRVHRSFAAAAFGEDRTPPTINIGVIEGGTEAYTTAARCVIEVTARYAPGERDVVDDGIRTAIADPGVSGEVTIEFCRDFDAAATPASDPMVEAVVYAVHGRIPGAATATMLATCDMRHYRNVLGVPSVVFGPGSLGDAHAPDEYVDWGDVVLAAKVLVDLAMQRADQRSDREDAS